jgi:cyclophilin family peptidyl-prolyl cis-trans isomerase
MSVMTGALILVGAGCGSGQVAVPPTGANGEASIGSRPINLSGSGAIRFDEETGKAEAVTEPPGGQAPPAAAQAGGGGGAQGSAAWPRPTSFPGLLAPAEIDGKRARIVTAKGTIVFELLAREAPKTVSNFVALARSGYFDGLTFHRVVPGFVIQGGDPRGDGTGGPGYTFEDEPVTLDYDAGIVAMANAGPDTNGSQFFIVLEDQPSLPKNYTIFGRVTSGMDAVRSIEIGDVMRSVAIEDR